MQEAVASTRSEAHACPCCGRVVEAPDVEIIIENCRVPNQEARILRALWRAKGFPVSTERLFDAMYADDPNGGPGRAAMYAALRVAVCRLRQRVAVAGVQVKHAHYHRGYQLKMEGHK